MTLVPHHQASSRFPRTPWDQRGRIASICIGAFTLAQAGLLDGRRATTPWLYGHELQSRFPKIKLEIDRIFIADDPVWTYAGRPAAISHWPWSKET
jgi:transcriptional regulator GlxA family with amidase domain